MAEAQKEVADYTLEHLLASEKLLNGHIILQYKLWRYSRNAVANYICKSSRFKPTWAVINKCVIQYLKLNKHKASHRPRGKLRFSNFLEQQVIVPTSENETESRPTVTATTQNV